MGAGPGDARSAVQSVAAVTQQLEATREELVAAVARRAESEQQAAALTAQLEAMECQGTGGPSGRAD